MTPRPRLTPAIADVRRAVRASLARYVENSGSEPRGGAGMGSVAFESGSTPEFPKGSRAETPEGARRPGRSAHAERPERPGRSAHAERPAGRPLVLVALSGGPDSLALAAATAFEAPRRGLRAGAVVIDHGLQEGSADAAAAASVAAHALGLDPVFVRTVTVVAGGGPEAAARTARYRALEQTRRDADASHILLGHTLDDQAESVLLGLARGSGPTSLHGMDAAAGAYLRPLLGVRRETTLQFCADSGLAPWFDPQNDDPAFARVRVRSTLLPALEAQLGPGVAEALARTAALLREDADALDHFAGELVTELAEHAEAGISLPVIALANNPAALRQRIIRLAVEGEFHLTLSRGQTLEVARLITHWRGQGAIDLPGVRVGRRDGRIVFSAHTPE